MSALNAPRSSGHVADLLPAFVNGTLPRSEWGQVMGHVQGCAACAADLRAWQAVREATRMASAQAPVVPIGILDNVWAALDGRASSQHPTTMTYPPEETMTPVASSLLPTIPAHPVTPVWPSWRPEDRAWHRILPMLLAVAAVLALVVAGTLIPQGRGLSDLGGLLPWQQEMPPDVPMFRGNPAHSGESPGPGPASKPEVLWRAKTGGQMKTSPALVNGVLFVGSLDGHIYAFDHATGEERWRVDIGGSPQAPPTVADGLVFAGDNNPYQTDGTLFVLDADDGREHWRLPDAQTSAPLVVDSTLYTGTSDGVFHAFDAGDGTERWHVETAPLSRGATLANGLLYYGGKDGTIYAHDAATGEERWRYQTDGGQLGTVAVVDGMAYEIAFDGPADQLYALDAATGEERWRFAIGARLQLPAVKDGVVFLPGGDGSVYALDAATGTVRWRFDVADPTVYGPILVGDTLYVAGGSPLLYAVDAATGKEQWHVELDGSIGTSPIVSGGVVYVTTDTGYLYALGEPGEERPVVLPASGDEATSGPAQFLWQAANGSEPIDQVSGMALAPDGSIWVVESNANRILIFSPDGAFREAWGTPGPSEGEFDFVLEDAGGGYGAVAFDQNGNFYVLDSGNYRVQKFDRTRRFVTAWGSKGSDDGQFLGPMSMTIDAQGQIYVGDDLRGDIQKFASDGTYLATIASRGAGEGQTQCIPGFGVDASGTLYVPDCWRHQIQLFAPDGTFVTTWGSEGKDEGQFQFPVDVAFDDAGHVYVADSANNRVQVFTANGTFLTAWGHFGSGEGEFNGSGTLALDATGNMYVGDGNGRIQKFRLRPPLIPAAIATPAS